MLPITIKTIGDGAETRHISSFRVDKPPAVFSPAFIGWLVQENHRAAFLGSVVDNLNPADEEMSNNGSGSMGTVGDGAETPHIASVYGDKTAGCLLSNDRRLVRRGQPPPDCD